MVTMRQSLFLVAGWLAAAIGAGLVASGAVAVAGGQVLDRPLRPLTAAEVAALPVPAVGSSEKLEPQASGGTLETTGESTAGSDTSSGSTTATIPTPRWDRFTNPSDSDTKVITIEAGRVSFAAGDDRIHVLWTSPGSGYVVDRLKNDDMAVTISFSSSRNVWLVNAILVDGRLVVSAYPAPFG